jgi:hypothetical protein
VRTATDAIIDVLETGGLTVGDKKGDGLSPPFVVVAPQTTTNEGTWGTDGAWEEIDKNFQVTCVGRSREQAEWLADRCDVLLFASSLVVRPIMRTGVHRDDTTGGPANFEEFVRYSVRAYR